MRLREGDISLGDAGGEHGLGDMLALANHPGTVLRVLRLLARRPAWTPHSTFGRLSAGAPRRRTTERWALGGGTARRMANRSIPSRAHRSVEIEPRAASAPSVAKAEAATRIIKNDRALRVSDI